MKLRLLLILACCLVARTTAAQCAGAVSGALNLTFNQGANMVLSKSEPRVYGIDTPGACITVHLHGIYHDITNTATADTNGFWVVNLGATTATPITKACNAGPNIGLFCQRDADCPGATTPSCVMSGPGGIAFNGEQLDITDTNNTNSTTITGILVGHLMLAHGQSNFTNGHTGTPGQLIAGGILYNSGGYIRTLTNNGSVPVASQVWSTNIGALAGQIPAASTTEIARQMFELLREPIGMVTEAVGATTPKCWANGGCYTTWILPMFAGPNGPAFEVVFQWVGDTSSDGYQGYVDAFTLTINTQRPFFQGTTTTWVINDTPIGLNQQKWQSFSGQQPPDSDTSWNANDGKLRALSWITNPANPTGFLPNVYASPVGDLAKGESPPSLLFEYLRRMVRLAANYRYGIGCSYANCVIGAPQPISALQSVDPLCPFCAQVCFAPFTAVRLQGLDGLGLNGCQLNASAALTNSGWHFALTQADPTNPDCIEVVTGSTSISGFPGGVRCGLSANLTYAGSGGLPLSAWPNIVNELSIQMPEFAMPVLPNIPTPSPTPTATFGAGTPTDTPASTATPTDTPSGPTPTPTSTAIVPPNVPLPQPQCVP